MRSNVHRGLHGHVLAQIGARIVAGDLQAGSTLDPEALEAEFGVSRSVVREVFKVLETKGLLTARPKRGTLVSGRDQWKLLDHDVLRWQFDQPGGPASELLEQLAEVRAIIEPAGAALAAARRTATDLTMLRAALEDLAAAGTDAHAITEADVGFHRLLLRAAHNDLLLQMELVIDAALQVRTEFVHRHDAAVRSSHSAHVAVFRAVSERKPAVARSRMEGLLRDAAQDVARVRRQFPDDGAV